ncbi:hypothetical protein GWI33_016162 [Rhynchophorus ferrugineus]|uniref:Cilia- and flagella-associated protein 53 n=1 Tax=Rhynchophorus ferrugineus TaxID=354439 RepID=A0A834M582_RHYFE|nr:hypothetical protein GWI33_016162 [Rhynchophorus ferrugineus]
MFGGDLVPPKCRSKAKKYPALDIQCPGLTPGSYSHIAREPNTDQSRLLHYKQRKDSFDQLKEEREKTNSIKTAFDIKYEKHVEMKQLQRAIDERVKQKMKAYEETVEQRRKKLQELLCKEEREYFYETIENAQKGSDIKMEQLKQRAQMLKAKREAERLEIVNQKRIEQYRNRCQELRPTLHKKNTMESKYTQLQQMRENEARRQADRELDMMWHELNMKEIQAKKEREVQEMLERKNKEKELIQVWDKQMKGKELLKEEMDKLAVEDRIEMAKLCEEIRREEINELDKKRRKRDATAKELLEQIAIQEKLQAQRKMEENALDQAFNSLAQLEIEREKAAIKDITTQARRETELYKKHLQQLEIERKQEEKKLMELLEIHRKEVEAKQNEARCKIVEAKRKLHMDVLMERAEQIKYQKQEAEQQLKLKEAENELLRMAFETNERLQAESDRLQKMEAMKYRDDLTKQIEYNNTLRQREQEELERQLADGVKEEEKYRKIVEEIIKGEIKAGAKHPFRAAIENRDCYCPSSSQI